MVDEVSGHMREMKIPLKELRMAKHVTQAELAKALHVSYQTVSKWENGYSLPDITYVPALAEFFQVELEVLLGMKPVEEEPELQNFAGEHFWEGRVEAMKNSKGFYQNTDYLGFLVREVWKIRRPVHILDCACGYGYLAEQLLPHLPGGSSYTGLDISREFLDEGKKMFAGDPRVRFVRGDILEYEFRGKYDLVISLTLLTYVPDPEAVIEKMKHALKPGGMLVAIDFNSALAEGSFFLAEGDRPVPVKRPDPQKVWEFSERSGELHWRTGTELPFLFRRCGLRQIRTRISDCAFTYDGRDPDRDEQALLWFRENLQQQERVRREYAYYLNRGCTWQEAEAFVDYQREVQRVLGEPDVFVSWACCEYIVWGFV